MTARELADRIAGTVRALEGRIMGVGRDQYERGGRQRFEDMPLPELVDEMRQELSGHHRLRRDGRRPPGRDGGGPAGTAGGRMWRRHFVVRGRS
jgi:hypothetical protein